MIAIMIIKQVALSLTTQASEKKRIIFLAPTLNLVEKQFKVLKENTDLTVDFYHGTKVFADLMVDPHQILMVIVTTSLRTIGYEIEVCSLEDSPVDTVWKNIGIPVSVVEANNDKKIITKKYYN
ncbi:hypothetical protein LXL04_024480 [Taraxacum kok-saghyz]